MNIFVYSHPEEYLTRVFLNRFSGQPDWRCISTEEFVENVQIKELASQEQVAQEWKLKDEDILFSKNHTFLDRVFSFQKSEGLFADPHFAELEMGALFYYLRKNSSKHISSLIHQSPNQWTMNLPSQWAFVESLRLEVSVPKYEFPYVQKTSNLNPDQLVIADFDNTINWKPGRHTNEERALGFERPKGNVLSILATPYGYISASNDSSQKAGEVAMELCRAFNTWFLEVILFQETINGQEKLTFGMVSAQPSTKFSNDQLEQFVIQEISKHQSKGKSL